LHASCHRCRATDPCYTIAMVTAPGQLLERIATEVRACTACSLHKTRTNAVPGEGPGSACVAFVGEAPGRDEDEQGRPFIGRSGQLLRRTIGEVGWLETDVFIGNVLKCRPPDNRDPLPEEIEQCRHFLMAQLVTISPKVIVTLGRFSLNLLIDPKLKISKIHGQHISKDGHLFLPTFHPSAILRNNNLLPDFRRDLRIAKKLSEG
jgi:uracil-DNA glycosylase family 4